MVPDYVTISLRSGKIDGTNRPPTRIADHAADPPTLHRGRVDGRVRGVSPDEAAPPACPLGDGRAARRPAGPARRPCADRRPPRAAAHLVERRGDRNRPILRLLSA